MTEQPEQSPDEADPQPGGQRDTDHGESRGSDSPERGDRQRFSDFALI